MDEANPKPHELKRCAWVGINPTMISYHDTEWGVPVRDERKLFEFIVLDAFQAGLSWQGVLGKRAGLRAAFAEFDYIEIARFDESKVQRLMQDTAIIRNQQKIRATIVNAQAVVRLHSVGTTLSDYLWGLVGNAPIENGFTADSLVPVKTELSERMSQGLRSFGFSFVGPTICYAFMQAAGMVNDHTVDCFRHHQVKELSSHLCYRR